VETAASVYLNQPFLRLLGGYSASRASCLAVLSSKIKLGRDYILIVLKNRLLSSLGDSVAIVIKTIAIITNLLSISKI
jgi:hypothetical protein